MRHRHHQHWLNVPTRRHSLNVSLGRRWPIVPASRYGLSVVDARRGMTLIEIMVVVGIIAILATLVVWGGGKYIDDAKVKQTRQVLSGLQNAITTYKDETGVYPDYPIDSDETKGPNGTTVPPYRSIPPVNPTDGGPEAQTRRVDFMQEDDGSVGGSASAAIIPDSPYPYGLLAYKLLGTNYVPETKKIYGIQMMLYRLVLRDSTSSYISKLPQDMLLGPGATKFPQSLMPQGAQFLGQFVRQKDGEEKTIAVREAQVILDAWNRPIYYGWHQNVNNGIPFLQSAGPDGLWDLRPMGGTAISHDDVFSFQKSQ